MLCVQDVMLTIFSYLEPHELLITGKVCKKWKLWTDHQALWKIHAQKKYLVNSLPFKPDQFTYKQHWFFFNSKHYQQIVVSFAKLGLFGGVVSQNEEFKKTVSLFYNTIHIAEIAQITLFSIQNPLQETLLTTFIKTCLNISHSSFFLNNLFKLSQKNSSLTEIKRKLLEHISPLKKENENYQDLSSLISDDLAKALQTSRFIFQENVLFKFIDSEKIKVLTLSQRVENFVNILSLEYTGWPTEMKELFCFFVDYYSKSVKQESVELDNLLFAAKTAENHKKAHDILFPCYR